MEILILALLYHLSQNPDFSESVKPLMDKIKNSEQMLRFLTDLSRFSETFSSVQNNSCGATDKKKTEHKPHDEQKKAPPSDEAENKNPQSPTKGIADEFIQNILDSYLKNQIK